jgi:hypothetical protein
VRAETLEVTIIPLKPVRWFLPVTILFRAYGVASLVTAVIGGERGGAVGRYTRIRPA